jgi:hydrogenase maturation protein HypF
LKTRVTISICGAVQGVGFRPFVFRLAESERLAGWIRNAPSGVLIEAEGDRAALDRFLLRLERERPSHAFFQSLEFSFLDPVGHTSFEIRGSDSSGPLTALILPDIATCPECRAEVLDPSDRRYRYPFTNCTNCGPRFTIIETLPYDRPGTTMRGFTMCPACQREYEDPRNRRFHAQPNACPACGPSLALWDSAGMITAQGEEALRDTERVLREGGIVAAKGIGGFHLLADARDETAVRRLRDRKHREEKPFAVMFPSLEAASKVCEVDPLEERLLSSSQSPIVLLRRRASVPAVAPSVAPGNPTLGVMLPYSPLHILLLRDLGTPIVATSGNLSDEPICIDEHEALVRLRGIADMFLVHNRPIVRHVDDSVVRVALGRELVLRRARGYAPLPVHISASAPDILAVGAHLKSTIAVARGGNVFISQHLGDLETEESLSAFRGEVEALQRVYAIRPAGVVSDRHPDYLSTAYARECGFPLFTVQHHHAHVASCMAENDLVGPVLGVSWDGTGYGDDGSVWGGEFLLTDARGFRRMASLRRFALPGGETAIREPRRSALGILWSLYGETTPALTDLPTVRAFTENEIGTLGKLIVGFAGTPETSSAGRLFDAVASLCGVRQRCSFEGQAAMELEWIAEGETGSAPPYGVDIRTGPSGMSAEVDWAPMIESIIVDVRSGVSPAHVASRFHSTLAASIVAVARRIGERRVVLTGGCFQNRILTERTVRLLTDAGFHPYWHQRVPPNDGGISLGQVYAVVRSGAFSRG